MSEYHLEISSELKKELKKIAKKDSSLLTAVNNKVEEIKVSNPDRYKNLNSPLQSLKRVHIDSHFVLLFSVDKNTHTIRLEALKHHDGAYKK